jgi:hypothetical protein
MNFPSRQLPESGLVHDVARRPAAATPFTEVSMKERRLRFLVIKGNIVMINIVFVSFF